MCICVRAHVLKVMNRLIGLHQTLQLREVYRSSAAANFHSSILQCSSFVLQLFSKCKGLQVEDASYADVSYAELAGKVSSSSEERIT